jgi:alpha-beta hydrolase superfamily lysophospholipase
VTGSPAPDREEELAVPDGALHVEHFLPAGPAAGLVVCVHGFDAHCGSYRHVGAKLAAEGFAAALFDCRGNGRSTGRRGHVTRFDQYSSDLAAVVQAARKLTPAGPLILLGHSQGGTIVLHTVLRDLLGARPDRMILATPWLGLTMPVPWWKRAASPVFARIWPTLTMASGIQSADLSRDPAVVEAHEKDPLVHHVASARWFEEALAAQAGIRAASMPLQVPTLVLVVGHDKIVSTEATLAFAEKAGAAVALRRYEGLFHELFLEPERDQVLADVVSWLRSPAPLVDLPRAPAAVPVII